MDIYQVIKRPLVTERTSDLIEQGIYTFEVSPEANKVQIAEAVEKIFNVGVISVNTLRIHRKQRRLANLLARAALRSGRVEEAARLYRDTFLLHPDGADAIVNYFTSIFGTEPDAAVSIGKAITRLLTGWRTG